MKIIHSLVFLLVIALFVAINPIPIEAQLQPNLEWELVNPFRFIRHQKTMDELRRVYDGLPDKTAAKLERALQDKDENEVSNNRRVESAKCQNKENAEARNKCIEKAERIPFRGWFAKLADEDYLKTCWNPRGRTYRSDGELTSQEGCKDYVNPIEHKVRVWLEGANPAFVESVKWLKDNELFTQFEKCQKSSICIEFTIPYDESRLTAINLTYQGQELTTDSPIRVTDKLIVGLGDSFASGEGNPDIPAQFTEGKTERDWFYQLPKGILSPSKDKGTEVGWLDEGCHRSMYSYQFKTALDLALANPKQAVTFISFACSGAETKNIYEVNQKMSGEKQKEVQEQLIALRNVLTRDEGNGSPVKTREIDYLLLSTGGNDIGFADIVADILLQGSRRTAYKLKILKQGRIQKELLFGKSNVIEKTALIEKTLLHPDTGNYRILNRKLEEADKSIRLKGKDDLKERRSRIFLTTYPNVLANEDENLCPLNRFEFDSAFGKDKRRGERLKSANMGVFLPLQEVQAKVEAELGWTLVTDHVKEFKPHGVCAQKDSEFGRTGEEFRMPTRRNSIWVPFQPWEYRTYESRQRWIRLPVDSKLSVDQRYEKFRRIFGGDFLFLDDRSTIMHPTAEGSAETADANVGAIREFEIKQQERERR